jgi:thioredoxin 1
MSEAVHKRIVEAGDDNYESIINDGLVLVDFWAEWCARCTAMEPVLKELVQNNSELTLAKVDVEENEAVATAFSVQSLPAMYLLDGGQQVDKFVGQPAYVQLNRAVQSHS